MNVLCFGDSNTYGYDPRGFWGGQYDRPWPMILAEKTGWNVCNLGENGREIPRHPTSFPENTECLIIMLGTNDLLQTKSAEEVFIRMEHFLTNIQIDPGNIVLIAPPPMIAGQWVSSQDLILQSRALSKMYRALSFRPGTRFMDSGCWDIPLAFDGVHFTEEGHRIFAEGIYHGLQEGE